METGRKRIRLDFAPLNVAVSLLCATPASPFTQVFNSVSGEYEPDRSVTPTVIQPVVMASAADGSWDNPYVNQLLSEMKWYVNGTDITKAADWNGLYEIDNSEGNTRGSLTVKRNLTKSQQVTVRFEALFADTRLGVNIPVESDEVVLSTSEVGADAYSVGIDEDTIIRYNPLADPLLLYEYKVAHGLMAASSSAESDARNDAKSYYHTVPILVYKGAQNVTSGYTVKLFRVNGTSFAQLSAGTDEVVSISTSSVVLDLRLVTKQDYVLRAYVDNVEIGMVQFSVNRMYPSFLCRPTNGAAILPTDRLRYDKAMADSDGSVLECPESVLLINWFTDTAAKTAVAQNEGGETIFDIKATGIGNTYTDNWIDVYTDAEHKPAYCVATDESGNRLTDEGGNILIFN